MASSSARGALAVVAMATLSVWPRSARAQQPAQGFALDRLYLSAPGAGWFVMDTLRMHADPGGIMSLTVDYAHDPLRVRSGDGSQRLTVVSDEAIADFGFGVTYERWRLYLDLGMPLVVAGQGGTVGAYQFTAPGAGTPFTPSGVNPGSTPDTLEDARVGLDVRLLGTPSSGFRLGAGAQLYVSTPNEDRSEYLTDGTLRAMGRLLFAGDVGKFTYAGQVGVHLRPVDDAPAPGGPQGSELLLGAAAGLKTPLTPGGTTALVVGPEVFGATAFRSFFGASGTEMEGLLSGRIEGTADNRTQMRVRLGIGAGLDPRFGAPEWRAIVGVEVFDRLRKKGP